MKYGPEKSDIQCSGIRQPMPKLMNRCLHDSENWASHSGATCIHAFQFPLQRNHP